MRYVLRNRNNFRPQMWNTNDLLRSYNAQNCESVSPMKVDIVEENESYKILAELPGHKKDDVTINVNEGVLTIEVKSEDKNEDVKYIHQERCVTEYKRSFRLDKTFDTDKITAEMAKGILTIDIPKTEKPTVKEITIN